MKGKPLRSKPTEPPFEKSASREILREQYQTHSAALHYKTARFAGRGGKKSFKREQKILKEIFTLLPRRQLVLDLPCGTGRFLEITASGRGIVLVDTSTPMILRAGEELERLSLKGKRVVGDAFDIPILSKSVDISLCYRFLHHLPDPSSRRIVFRELERISRVWIVLSFFNRFSFSHGRRAVRRIMGRPTARYAISFRTFCREAGDAGLSVVKAWPSVRFFSEQWTVLLRKKRKELRRGWLFSKAKAFSTFADSLGPSLSFDSVLAAAGVHEKDRFIGRLEGPSGSPGLYVKLEPTRRILRRLFRKLADFSRPLHPYWREFHILDRLQAFGLPVPAPLAAGCRIAGRAGAASFVITEEIAGAISLKDCLAKMAFRSPTKRKKIIASVAGEVRRLHDARFFHRDLFPRNILVRDGGGGRWEVFFLDCRKGAFVRFPRLHPFRGALYDLACLERGLGPLCSRTERLHSLRIYLKGKDSGLLKTWATRIWEASKGIRHAEKAAPPAG